MINQYPERDAKTAPHLGDVLTDIAAFFAPSGSEQAGQHDRQQCAEAASGDVVPALHKDASA